MCFFKKIPFWGEGKVILELQKKYDSRTEYVFHTVIASLFEIYNKMVH